MPRWWLAIGPEANWHEALKHGNIWGLKGDGRPALMWETIAAGDRVLFYVTTPLAGVVGYGTIRGKFKQDKPLWSDELNTGKVLWPLRFEFDVDYIQARDSWRESLVTTKALRTMARAGFQSVDDSMALEIVRQFGESTEPATIGRSDSEHTRLVNALVEAGRLQKFIAEKEYQMGNERLDAVWRRVEGSVPTFVFEVQIGGDPYHALGKLKHAFDIWNSRIFLVAYEQDHAKVNTLLSGTFHEIQPQLRFIEASNVRELVRRKRELRDLEDVLGII